VRNPRVSADFHNADTRGRLRLNCIGTREDLTQQQIVLREGVRLTLYSEELEVEEVVEYSTDKHLWGHHCLEHDRECRVLGHCSPCPNATAGTPLHSALRVSLEPHEYTP
jgi:hypothetical protein